MKNLSVFLLWAAVPGFALTSQAQSYTAFKVNAGQVGHQAFNGALGMEFNVASPITVTRLGCFDDLSDGLTRQIQVRLYNRAAPATAMAVMDFLIDDPGTVEREDGELLGGSRFLTLPAPLNLPAGFQGMIVASNYGTGERDGNRPNNLPWTTEDGGGLIDFTGCRSHYSADPLAYPGTVDGTFNHYAAGTFQYQVNGGILPGSPAPVLAGGNGQVKLDWAAVTTPVAAESYRIERASSASGAFTQIAQTAALTYTDTALVNGTVYYYRMVSVAPGSVLSATSTVQAAAPWQLAADHHIAYFTPENKTGNQTDFAGSLGMDFDVQNEITLTRLGAFDSGADGIQPAPGPDGITGTGDDLPRLLTARIYNRDTLELLASLEFTPEGSGTLIGSMRFKPLAEPLVLPAGFHGCIVASGYGAGEPLFNSGRLQSNAFWTLDNGQSSIVYTGTGRYGTSPDFFPGTTDATLAAGYAAGTFEFVTSTPAHPGVPAARLAKPFENTAATLVWDGVTAPLPAASYRVYRYDPFEVSYILLGETTQTTFRVTGIANGEEHRFVVSAVTSGGVEGAQSATVIARPVAAAAGIAYINQAYLTGTQGTFAGSLGMDFNVVNPVRVTRLGTFDSQSDGLTRAITVILYDRVLGTPVAGPLVLSPDDPATPGREDGELEEGSRFVFLAEPLLLPAGFQGSIVTFGYGEGEPNGNNPVPASWTTFGGGCLSFTGSSRWDNATGGLPANIDTGAANKFAAGTFAFEPFLEWFDGGLTILPQPGQQVKINWTAPAGVVLQQSSDMAPGSWAEVPGAVTGLLLPVNGREFFRLFKP